MKKQTSAWEKLLIWEKNCLFYNILRGWLCDSWKPALCLALYSTGVHFWGELQHVGDVSEQIIKCRPIRTRQIGADCKTNYVNIDKVEIFHDKAALSTRTEVVIEMHSVKKIFLKISQNLQENTCTRVSFFN